MAGKTEFRTSEECPTYPNYSICLCTSPKTCTELRIFYSIYTSQNISTFVLDPQKIPVSGDCFSSGYWGSEIAYSVKILLHLPQTFRQVISISE